MSQPSKERCVSDPAYQETLCQKVGRKFSFNITAGSTYVNLIASHTMPVCLPLAPSMPGMLTIQKALHESRVLVMLSSISFFFHKTEETVTMGQLSL